jgi:hypothetical protein
MLAVDNLILDPPKPHQLGNPSGYGHHVSSSAWQGWVFVKLITTHDSKGSKAGSHRPGSTSYKGPYPMALSLISHNPLQAAIAFGKQTDHCSRCNRKLTVPTSIAQSMGPICIQHFHPQSA